MRAEPFALDDARRVIDHPDTPAAYVDWVEVLPLTGTEDRTHLGNLLSWSHRTARSPLGASRATFEEALRGVSEDALDAWMQALASLPVEDFVDHHVPFLRNLTSVPPAKVEGWVREFLAAQAGDGPAPAPGAPRQRAILPRPDSVLVEITRSCNFACTMCSSRTGGFLSERTMPLPVFGEIVRVFGPAAKSLRINGYGETTLVPGLHRYLDCLDEFCYQGLREIITNLSAPLPVYEDLFARGFVLLVSWDAANEATFERIRVGADYRRLEERLRALGRTAAAQRERVGLLFTLQESNLDEVVPVVRLAAEAGIGFVLINMIKEADGSPWMETRFAEITGLFARAEECAVAEGVALRLPDHVGSRRVRLPQAHRSSGTYCDRPWRELLIRWDTEATICNMFHPWSYGLLCPPGPPRDLSTRFERLWRGPNASVIRRHVNSDNPHPYCEGCYFLHP